MSTQIILAPGFWLGSWAWDEVANALREEGFEVTALTLPGREPRLADDGAAEVFPDGGQMRSATVTPQDQADAIIAVLDPDADRRVLVVHSGAAVPGTLVIDQHPDRVDHVVWVDTAPTSDGHAMDADFDREWLLLEDAWDEEQEQGAMRELTEQQRATFRERAVPEPGAVVSTPVRLADDRRHDVPSTVICTSFSADEFRSYAEQGVPFLAALPDYRDLAYVDLPTGHWPMWSRPQELADLIARYAG